MTTTTCEGRAVASLDGGTRLTLDDGSSLTWAAALAAPLEAPPLGEGQQVSVELTFTRSSEFTVRETRRCSIRDTSGQLLWVAVEGESTDEPTADLLSELFGVGASSRPACSEETGGSCSFHRTRFDHELATSPSTQVPADSLTHVTTPNGRWDVRWTLYTDELRSSCADVAPPWPELRFVARRVGP